MKRSKSTVVKQDKNTGIWWLIPHNTGGGSLCDGCWYDNDDHWYTNHCKPYSFDCPRSIYWKEIGKK